MYGLYKDEIGRLISFLTPEHWNQRHMLLDWGMKLISFTGRFNLGADIESFRHTLIVLYGVVGGSEC